MVFGCFIFFIKDKRVLVGMGVINWVKKRDKFWVNEDKTMLSGDVIKGFGVGGRY